MYWVLFTIWPLLNYLLNKEYCQNLDSSISIENKNKIVRNLISAVHSIGCVVNLIFAYYTSLESWRIIAVLYSMGYFIWDSYLIIILNYVSEFPYLIHHCISLHIFEYVLFNNYNTSFVLLLILYGELSNFPNYLVYHKIKKQVDKNDNILLYTSIKYWKHIQILWFVFFRIIVYGRYLTTLYTLVDSYVLSIGCYTLYIMGIYWTYGQIKSLCKEYYSNQGLKNE